MPDTSESAAAPAARKGAERIMGGLPCAKAVLDQRAALDRALACMSNSILLNADSTQPTEEMLDTFTGKANDLATLASKIQAYVEGA